MKLHDEQAKDEQAQAVTTEPAAGVDAAREGAAGGAAPLADERTPADIEYDVIAAMKTVYDPEIPVDIYELGLIYELNVADDGNVHIVMTLTTPMCPAAEILPPEVESKARAVEGVRDVRLDLVWDPPWSMDMMSPAARLQLNL